MKCQPGLVVLVWQIAATGCTTTTSSSEGACLLQLRSENEALIAALDRHPVQSLGPPSWSAYPSDLAHILETMVVTRYWGNEKHGSLGEISSTVPVPRLYEKFDCVRHVAFEKTTSPCRTLLCQAAPDQIAKCASEIEHNTLNVASGEFVAFFGEDTHLSAVLGKVKTIGSHFQRTYFEGYDILDDDIDVLPIGLQEYYLRYQDFSVMVDRAERPDWLPTAIQDPTLSFPPSTREAKVLGSHGAFWTIENPSRQSAADLCTSHGQEPWISCGQVRTEDWWATLSTYSFLLNPAGNGIQSPKFHEALLMGVVPICTKQAAFVKLAEKGWPVLLVDSFMEVADMNLTQKYEDFRPQLASINKYLFLEGYWDYLQTGHV